MLNQNKNNVNLYIQKPDNSYKRKTYNSYMLNQNENNVNSYIQKLQ